MGLILLGLILLFEIAYAVYCMATKTIHTRLRASVRIAGGVMLVILLLTPAAQWSFRWVLPALLLLLLTGRAAYSLARQRADQALYRPVRILMKAFTMIVLSFIAFAPLIVFPPYTPPRTTGEYAISTETHTFTDEDRLDPFASGGKKRFVNVQFWYPRTDDGSFPLLVFSHGANGIKASNASTFRELASHGYVVCSIDHPHHALYSVSEDGERTFIDQSYLKEVQDANQDGIYTTEQVYGLIQKWMRLRTDDMDFVIDTVLAASQGDGASVYSHIDASRIGVFGHSMGGAASVWVGRERSDVDAVVNLDGPMFSELTYDSASGDFKASGKPYATPLFNLYSDDVWGQLQSNSTYAGNAAADRNAADMRTVHFKGAKHLSFTDLSMVSPLLANLLQGGEAAVDAKACLETENRLILQFFDEVLKGKGRFAPEADYGPELADRNS
ncbi:alpha/beta hydrolase family protein [Paenibacillus aurantiacus]|uniref:Alpha/beta hydrolase family protein n=1 Tax=Paenibacillus aurantiacus TaxID=1936118 RepID=A0ABV5KMM1_9BACL